MGDYPAGGRSRTRTRIAPCRDGGARAAARGLPWPRRVSQAVRRFLLGRRRRTTTASARKASFTEAESGKTSKTSGSMTTTFEPFLYRATVAPRSAPLKSYSGRIVSRSELHRGLLTFFFILLSFASRCAASGNESGSRRAFDEGHDEKPIPRRMPQDEIALLVDGVIRIREQHRGRVSEDRCDTSSG